MILSVQHVVKTYGTYRAVNDVSLEVPKGTVFGMLGPNGAGKTSLIRMITTITAPDEGKIYLDGELLNSRSPEKVGYMPEERGLYKKMKVGEQLLYLAQLKGLTEKQAKDAIDYWLNRFEIASWWEKKVEDLSKGMQQKIQFIATILHRPRLLILDEPFTGLDPINTNLIKDEIRLLNESGISIIFSTHRMEQVEEMCNHIVLINKGRNVLYGEVQAIKKQYKKNLYTVELDGVLPDGVQVPFPVVKQEKGTYTFKLDREEESSDLLRFFLQQPARIVRFEEILPSFNEIFIQRVAETETTA